jgi:hypothetical protein
METFCLDAAVFCVAMVLARPVVNPSNFTMFPA